MSAFQFQDKEEQFIHTFVLKELVEGGCVTKGSVTDMEKWEHGKVSCFIQQDILRIIPKRIVPDELDSKDEVELIEDEVIDEIESKQLK